MSYFYRGDYLFCFVICSFLEKTSRIGECEILALDLRNLSKYNDLSDIRGKMTKQNKTKQNKTKQNKKLEAEGGP
jgi:hypothetical protein